MSARAELNRTPRSPTASTPTSDRGARQGSMRQTMITSDDERRTTALAYWRYAHEYLRAARGLRARHHLTCAEMQPLYHLAAQAIEFGFKAFLRARGMPAREVLDAHTQELGASLAECMARGLPAPDPGLHAAVRLLAPHHRRDAFVPLATPRDDVPDLDALFDAGHWLLDAIVPAGRHRLHRALRGQRLAQHHCVHRPAAGRFECVAQRGAAARLTPRVPGAGVAAARAGRTCRLARWCRDAQCNSCRSRPSRW